MGAAKVTKTPDEVACIRNAQLINELAMVDALTILRPGIRQIDLSAVFLRRIFELGASANGIDPIWQVMAPTRELGPWTLHGDLAYPTVTTDRFLREGDVIWVDAGITFQGYASDYGRTWITGADPTPNHEAGGAVPSLADGGRRRAGHSRTRGVGAATRQGRHRRPTTVFVRGSNISIWLTVLALTALKCHSSEPISASEFDDRLIMQPGMVVVFEPVIWEDGAAGYRSEDIVAVTDTGWVKLSGSTYDPYGVSA